ncbi:MAG: phosphate ABC transporter permease subunit PstC, partial [Methylocystis sp.]|nr:phosphate ABC transporter permease subunit PstC [Methylocystis sp.]
MDRTRVLARIALVDRVFHQMTRAAAVVVLIILGGVIVSLVHGSWPAMQAYGFGFLTSQAWNPVTEN